MSSPASSWARIASSVASSQACCRPQLLGAHARRKTAGELLAVDQPVGLRKAADDGGGEEHGAVVLGVSVCRDSNAGHDV
jgi:hypothetical protein